MHANAKRGTRRAVHEALCSSEQKRRRSIARQKDEFELSFESSRAQPSVSGNFRMFGLSRIGILSSADHNGLGDSVQQTPDA
jgi:hypothetical protein